LSTKNSAKKVKLAKLKGLNITADVALHNLFLTDEAVNNFDTRYKVMPPLRTKKDNKALINALKDGTIDIITSDHNPIDIEHKKVEFSTAKDGTIGLESAFGVLNSVLDLETINKCLSENPKNRFGIKNNSIQKSELANLTLFTPSFKYTFEKENIISTSKNSIFINKELNGKVYGIYNNNQLILNS
jgi:dihydroorotase